MSPVSVGGMTENRLVERYRKVSGILGIFIALAAVVVFIGWLFDVPLLKSVFPGYVSMKFNTAVCFFLVGLSLYSYRKSHVFKSPLMWISAASAVSVLLIGLLTVCEYALGWNPFWIDQLFFRDESSSSFTSHPGRMALNTAVSFAVMGLALLVLRSRREYMRVLAQLLVVGVCLISLLSLTGYLYGANPLIFGVHFSTAMALHTTILFTAAGVSYLFASPKRGLMREVASGNLGGMTMRRLLPFTVLIPISIGWLSVWGERLRFFDSVLGISFVAMANLAVLSAFLYFWAVHLNRSDEKRQITSLMLQVSEYKYRRLFETSHDGILVLDLETGKVENANPALSELLKKAEPELRNASVWDAGIFRDEQAWKDCARLLRNEGRVRYGSLPLGIKGGRTVDVELIGTIFEANDREMAQLDVRDITERKRAEETLRASEQRYRSTLDDMMEGCQIIGSDWRYLYVNEAAAHQARSSVDELRGKKFTEFWPGVGETKLYSVMRDCMASRTACGLENPFQFPDGETGWFDLRIQPVPEGLFVLSMDITASKRAAKEIFFLNNRLQILIDAVQEVAAARDLQSIMAVVRSRARALIGSDGTTFVLRDNDQCYYADEDAVGPLWKGRRFPMSACISGWVMLNKQPAVIEDIYADPRIPIDAYRSTFVKSLAMVPIRTQDPLGAIGNYWAHSHKPSEMELRLMQTLADAAARAVENVRLLEELERRVRERTAQLETANKELEAFSYSVSHDLRAPLRHISGYIDLLKRCCGDSLPEEGPRYLETIRTSAVQMGKLIDDLLLFSRTARQELRPAETDMNTLLREALETVKEEAGERQVQWIVSALPRVVADGSLLKLVWQNLLSNAVKFTRNREEARIEVGYREDDNEFVFFVRDNGAGFNMQYVQKLFGVFQRLHSSSEFEGTGIGLANVRRIILRHGGRTWAESEPGKGAVFYFSLNKSGEKHGSIEEDFAVGKQSQKCRVGPGGTEGV